MPTFTITKPATLVVTDSSNLIPPAPTITPSTPVIPVQPAPAPPAIESELEPKASAPQDVPVPAGVTTPVYPADSEDFDGPLPSNTSGTWEVLKYESPMELMYMHYPALQSGEEEYHPWQIEVTEELASVRPTKTNPYKFCLCAANGSGKDTYIVTPFVIWFALTKIRALVIVTSSSGVQLTAQTENYIASLARLINTFYGEPIFKITKRFIKCLKSGSEIRLFATDEEGKAEGYHPFPDYPGAEMAIVVNEAKTVKPEIYRALERCTGYNYWLNVSTPGEPRGDFYWSFNNWKNVRRVTAFDCTHLPLSDIEENKLKHGEHSSIYRSKVLALFTANEGEVVINQDHLNRCIELSRKRVLLPKKFGKVKVGIDTAAGRDETAGMVVHGNAIVASTFFVEKNTVATEVRLDSWLNGLYITHGGKDNIEIRADDGGVSHGIVDHLIAKGHTIIRVLNQQRAYDHRQYGNRGTEMWYNVRRIIEEGLLYLPLDETHNKDDKKLYNQLSLRHFTANDTNGRILLMSKKDEKGEGHDSPDRADALVLALSSTLHEDIAKALATSDKREMGMTIEQITQQRFDIMRSRIPGYGVNSHEPLSCNCSLELAMQSQGLL